MIGSQEWTSKIRYHKLQTLFAYCVTSCKFSVKLQIYILNFSSTIPNCHSFHMWPAHCAFKSANFWISSVKKHHVSSKFFRKIDHLCWRGWGLRLITSNVQNFQCGKFLKIIFSCIVYSLVTILSSLKIGGRCVFVFSLFKLYYSMIFLMFC